MRIKIAALVTLAIPTCVTAQVTSVVTKMDSTGKVTETDTTTTAGTAAAQAQIGLATSIVPASGISPATSLASGAGTEEASMLEPLTLRTGMTRLHNQPFLTSAHNVLIIAQSSQVPDATA